MGPVNIPAKFEVRSFIRSAQKWYTHMPCERRTLIAYMDLAQELMPGFSRSSTKV